MVTSIGAQFDGGQVMKLFSATAKTSGAQRFLHNMLVAAVCVLTAISANTASADRTYTTVVRETVYHSPSRVIVSPRVIVPVNRSIYVGIGSGTIVTHQPRHTVIYREVTRRHDRHDEDYYRDSSYRRSNEYYRNNNYRRDSDYRRDVIYEEKDGRRNSSYRETETRSVEIRHRSR